MPLVISPPSNIHPSVCPGVCSLATELVRVPLSIIHSPTGTDPHTDYLGVYRARGHIPCHIATPPRMCTQ
ncbi:hypothetical protein KIPB_016575 [Kipferlia bialata]|uniref:Uncharacterized protein n=1 Tax=Kipferlia bialata TaxID=797122 RepID=A0A9K3DCV2_9EUKA|nr:hypothetical protein KIPB_016575 [Kipferlia bialata]|eukprot:g16575.t1